MKRLLLLALPALLAGCPKPNAAGEATTPPTAKPADAAEPAAPAAADTAPAAAPKIEFSNVGMVQTMGNLPKFHWRLASATDAKGQPIDALQARPAQPVTLDFRKGQIAVSNTCNRMSGRYTLGPNKLTIDKLASTMMACADPKLMALDREVGKHLQGDLAMRMSTGDDRQIELKTTAGGILVFAGVRTAESRYRSEGERTFLEVAAQTKPCSHPLVPGKQCLQVRELKYDDKGLKVGTSGAFGNFYAEIEGYTHEPGIRNVLRVDRYTIENPPADASKYAYVLDMVVESDASAKQ